MRVKQKLNIFNKELINNVLDGKTLEKKVASLKELDSNCDALLVLALLQLIEDISYKQDL